MRTELHFAKFQNILLISCLSTGFRTANKECHRNYALNSKEQHWRSPAKKLEEEKTTRLQGREEKPRGTEKLKRILISQVND